MSTTSNWWETRSTNRQPFVRSYRKVSEDQPQTVTPESSASAPASAAPVTNAITPEVLKSAFNAFKKRWKLTLLDHESRIGRGPMSSGNKSNIVGINPPDQFPRAV